MIQNHACTSAVYFWIVVLKVQLLRTMHEQAVYFWIVMMKVQLLKHSPQEKVKVGIAMDGEVHGLFPRYKVIFVFIGSCWRLIFFVHM